MARKSLEIFKQINEAWNETDEIEQITARSMHLGTIVGLLVTTIPLAVKTFIATEIQGKYLSQMDQSGDIKILFSGLLFGYSIGTAIGQVAGLNKTINEIAEGTQENVSEIWNAWKEGLTLSVKYQLKSLPKKIF